MRLPAFQLTNHLTDSTQIRAHAKSLSTACYGNYHRGKREEGKEEGNNRKAVASMPSLLPACLVAAVTVCLRHMLDVG